MDGQELIQVNLQLPAGALESLARLTEQLRLLTESANRQESAGTRQTLEQGENRFFDPEQFRALRQDAEMKEIKEPPAAGQAVEQTPEMEAAVVQVSGETLEADSVRPEMQNDVYTPKDAGRDVKQNVEDPAQAGSPIDDASADVETAIPDIQDGPLVETAEAEMQESPSAETIQQDVDRIMEEIPAVQAENQPVSDPEAVQIEPESQIPAAETAWEQAEIPGYEPVPVRVGISEGTAAPVSAGFVLASGPDTPRSRWTGGSETLAVSGGAPLTAEDVSLAFQRDERRYDNGFPLY